MTKSILKLCALIVFLLPVISFSTEQEFEEMKDFVEKVFLKNKASFEETQHSKSLSFLSSNNCSAKYTHYTGELGYATIHIRAAEISFGNFYFSAASSIQLERNSSNEIIKATIHAIEQYDCEEEGCSEEGPVVHIVSETEISSQTYTRSNDFDGSYDLQTVFCRF